MFAHSGYYCAAFGAVYDENDLITQALTTTPGSTYTFSFWLAADAESYLTASWNGTPVLNITPASGGFWWEQFSFIETASGPTTTIGFAGRNAPAYIYLDDVSVTAVPDGGATASLLGLGLIGLGALRRRQS